MSYEDKNIEDDLIIMMTKFKYAPLQIGDQIPNELYQRIVSRWKYALRIEKEMRSMLLENLIPYFGLEDTTGALEKHKNRFI